MRRYVFVALALAALGTSQWLMPSKTQAVAGQAAPDLASIAPRQIGEWQTIDVPPDVALGDRGRQQTSAKLYEDVLMRTYRRERDGAILWLVVAYGGDQRASFTVHMPEVCYRSLGYEVEPRGTALMHAGTSSAQVRRLVARSPERIEPITYWVIMGDEIVDGQMNVKLRELWNGLTARAQSGTLVRVSMPVGSVPDDSAYQEHQAFIRQLVDAWPQASRQLIWPEHQS